ncbi:hypothetical protein CPAR01_03192 [Colletotrichum paranaense]|uniref:Uncharacterized protein n=1 Tax=Colletotrichum paranaense TaxID=1914294 RepID=A0ABQ9T275_9PEZI|nr:uncharacterized protein CPAR01_03192 [Colletotrichum paranaense]KAK1545690.1 hypothetical protein CPAR01_03192 [Colletotrichum paranaense]
MVGRAPDGAAWRQTDRQTGRSGSLIACQDYQSPSPSLSHPTIESNVPGGGERREKWLAALRGLTRAGLRTATWAAREAGEIHRRGHRGGSNVAFGDAGPKAAH